MSAVCGTMRRGADRGRSAVSMAGEVGDRVSISNSSGRRSRRIALWALAVVVLGATIAGAFAVGRTTAVVDLSDSATSSAPSSTTFADVEVDLYSPPADIPAFIERATASTIRVF